MAGALRRRLLYARAGAAKPVDKSSTSTPDAQKVQKPDEDTLYIKANELLIEVLTDPDSGVTGAWIALIRISSISADGPARRPLQAERNSRTSRTSQSSRCRTNPGVADHDLPGEPA
jgi:hypothetical protein